MVYIRPLEIIGGSDPALRPSPRKDPLPAFLLAEMFSHAYATYFQT